MGTSEGRVKNHKSYFTAIFFWLILSLGWSLWAADPAGAPKPPPTSKPAAQPTTTILKDSTPVTTYPDGTKTSQYEPGSSYTQHPDGSKTVGETSRTPDGKSVRTEITYKPDGTRIKKLPDDPNKPPVEDKPVATRSGKKGLKEYTYADGEVVKFKQEAFQVEKRSGREIQEFKYDAEGGRKIELHYKWMSSAPFSGEMRVATLIDNRPDYNICVAGDVSVTQLAESFYSKFKTSGYSIKPLGSMSGYGHVFSTNAPAEEYNTWLQNSGNRSCEGFDAELNFCTLMAPLTAFRGHDHEHHHGAVHSHDAPDPPLSWGRNPPRINVRLDRAPGGRGR